MHANRMPKSWNSPISAVAPPERARHGAGAPPGRDARGSVPRDMAGDVASHTVDASDTVDGGSRQLRATRTPAADIAADPSVRLTGRGGVLAVFAISFAGAFAASAAHVGVLAGISYVAACVFAASVVRRGQLLPVVVTPPMLFALAVLSVQAITATGGVLSVAGGTVVTLGNVAPWLFAGSAAGSIIALARGLAGDVRALRESLRGDARG